MVPLLTVLNFILTDSTHSGGTDVLQVTLALGIDTPTLSALAVTVLNGKSAAARMMVNMFAVQSS